MRGFYIFGNRIYNLRYSLFVINRIVSNDYNWQKLGEMNAKNLYESTMQKENRTLLRYTLESAVKEIEMVRYIESNREELLKNVNVTKQDLLN